MSTEQLAADNKPDREKILYAGAKAEGKVTWHTSLAGDSYKNLAAAYEARHPGVSPESYRATLQEMTARIVAESQAQGDIADAMENTIPLLKLLKDNQWLVPDYFPTHAKYPDHVKENAPKGLVFWAIDRESHIGLGYNTKLCRSTSYRRITKTCCAANSKINLFCRQRHRRHRGRRHAKV